MKRNTSSTTSLTDMGVKSDNGDNKLNIIETGEEGTLDYRLRYAMAEHSHRCVCTCVNKAAAVGHTQSTWRGRTRVCPQEIYFVYVVIYVRG